MQTVCILCVSASINSLSVKLRQESFLLRVMFIFAPLCSVPRTGEGNSDPTKLMEALQKRVKRQENLLQKCKEVMRTHKERSAQLGTENETLQEQLQERLQELEKIKVAHRFIYFRSCLLTHVVASVKL